MHHAARRVGILGGTFDPIHRGHVDIGDAAQAALGLTEVHVVTSHVPPHRPPPETSLYHRFAMVALTTAERPAWRASDLELRHEAPRILVASRVASYVTFAGNDRPRR